MDEIQPSIIEFPTVRCELSSTTSDERDTLITDISYNIYFNDGKYTNSDNTGVKITNYSFSSGESSSSVSTSGILTLPENYAVGTSNVFSVGLNIYYSDGNVAKTNLGNDSDPTVKIEAGNTECVATFLKTAVDYPYYTSSAAATIEELAIIPKTRKTTALIGVGEVCNYNTAAYV